MIVGHITSRADRQALRLTCRLFESLVSQHLFRKISVSHMGNDLFNFLRIAYSPRLNKHVQELTWLELNYSAAELNRVWWHFPASEASSHEVAMAEPLGLFWHSYLPLDVPSGFSYKRRYKVHDGLLPVFLEAIARMPKLRTFNSAQCDYPAFRRRCGDEVALARCRDFLRQFREGPYRGLADLVESFLADGILLKVFELYLLPALAQKSVADGRWLQVHWVSDTYLTHRHPQAPLRLTHVPCISENLVEFTFGIRDIDCNQLPEPQRRLWHLEVQHKLLGCLQNAKNLKTLRLTGKERRSLDWHVLQSLQPAHKDYFFDLLVGPAAGPNCGKLHLPKLQCLSLQSISYSQAGLAKFIQRHSDTLRALELSDCRLEFATVKDLARMDLRLDKFEVTSVRLMVDGLRATNMIHMHDGAAIRPVWTRIFEYVLPQSLLKFVNSNTTPEAQWATLEPGRFGRIPYEEHFNFFVTTEDVRACHFDMDPHAPETDPFVPDVPPRGKWTEQDWEKLFEEGNGVDFRKPQDEEMRALLGEQHRDSKHHPIDGAVIYPTGEKPPVLVTSDPVLLEHLKRRALELSLTAADVGEIQVLMDNCKREEAELKKEGSE